MKTVLCTLYNSLYLDKGLVLYDSLCECSKDFILYVLCMDDKCYEVLSDINQSNHIPIRLTDFEKGDDELLEAKSNRSFGEYCWTCSSSLIKYVLNEYKYEICTYIDADMYFYQDPQILVDEMLSAGKSVMMVPHRFPSAHKHLAQTIGTYCVQFNTFVNCSEGLEVLDYWRKRCLECCSLLEDGDHFGDQKYLDELKEKFSTVYGCKNLGAGVATWNIESYKVFKGYDSPSYKLVSKTNTLSVPLVFYHFASINYYSRKLVTINVRNGNPNIDYELINRMYESYLFKIDIKKEFLLIRYGLYKMIMPTNGFYLLRRIIFGTRAYKYISQKKLFSFLHLPYVIKVKKKM